MYKTKFKYIFEVIAPLCLPCGCESFLEHIRIPGSHEPSYASFRSEGQALRIHLDTVNLSWFTHDLTQFSKVED